MKVFSKILVANRGEIALRIFRSLKAAGIKSVAVYSYGDRGADFVKAADEAYLLEGKGLSETYLDMDKITRIAIDSQSDAVHPGYGFLSENHNFARKLISHGIVFIGPRPDNIEFMGDKEKARKIALKAGLPVLKGLEGDKDFLAGKAGSIGYPVLVKASAGGGGKAMRIAYSENDLHESIEVASREAENYFGNSNLILEKYLENARHIEIQVLCDSLGNILILGERECSVQRRYQKVIEEAPAVSLSEPTRQKLYTAAISLVREMGYENAGTLEFLVDRDQSFYFLEMNTRIQVEHPVTEMVYGLDIVSEQVRIAEGKALSMKQEDVSARGHAIEARLYAEDPRKDFIPSPGNILLYNEPDLRGIRIDASVSGPSSMSPEYDPMISKIISHGKNRDESRLNLITALKNMQIAGLSTNREFLWNVLEHNDFVQNRISTRWLEKERQVIIDGYEGRKTALCYPLIAAWLIKQKFYIPAIGSSLWERLGRWRQHDSFTVTTCDKQFFVSRIHRLKESLDFSLDGHNFCAKIISFQKDSIHFELGSQSYQAAVLSGMNFHDTVLLEGYDFQVNATGFLPALPYLKEKNDAGTGNDGIVRSPLHGRIVKLSAGIDSRVEKGEHILTLDAMKIENKILSPLTGYVRKILIREGEQVSMDQTLIEIEQIL